MKIPLLLLTLTELTLGRGYAFGQDSTWAETLPKKSPVQIFTELGLSGSTSHRTPFWLRTNQYGIVPNSSPFVTARAGIKAQYGDDRPRLPDARAVKHRMISWGYGLEAVANLARKPEVLLSEAYVNGKLRGLELMIGRRREIIGLADSSLGTGSYSWSGNALPMPKIQLSLYEYTPIGFTRGIVAFRGLYAHGWFGNKGPVTHSYLHQKALYGRLGKPNWLFRFYGGFNHQVQWAGRSKVITDDELIKNGRFPGGFTNYLHAVTGLSLAAKGDAIDTTEYSKNDRGNRLGNHLGSIDLGFEVNARAFSLLFYRQSIYEDGSLYYLTNIADGLNGIRYRNGRGATQNWQIQSAVLEFLYTKSQGGATFSYIDRDRGADNYFNHGQYIDGWSYRGRTIGTPFIPPAIDTNPALPRPTTGPFPFFTNNNRLWVMHAGLAGRFRTTVFQLKCSYSDNSGTYLKPFPEKTRQFSSRLMVHFPVAIWGGMQSTVSLATDRGNLYPNSTGLYISLRKTWN
ncbi:capsule assembly protein Wzi [Larkinella arboricola]|uniref:Capsule assembly protein Wzi n=1 Tax=Larkinella arboricola TaxID=643671 RepID=A0A327WPJ6_LARAB|nr:capsule assembly Wzi family protein [Larkinella arboricola]RAJ92618.1 capsule assembly protein Wzi [Larkinella arboricola]